MSKAMRKLKVSMAASPWDLGQTTAAQLRGKTFEKVIVVDRATGKAENPEGAIRARRETWVDRYERKEQLTAAQAHVARALAFAAEGERQRDPLAALGVVDASGQVDRAAAYVDRRRRFHRMWADVPQFARPVVAHVVLGDGSLGSLCGGGRDQARHLDRLQRGLEALVERCQKKKD
ncbi:hypothetical protein [Thioclava kandeliae]|uniref:Uncharacterized protein n=1 Tax=Thioclava kandeliae TaxID=3070818 RepID=A0ABV1SKS8_9RHOB